MHRLLSGNLMQKFSLDGELTFFEKSSAASGKQKRIAGIISTEIKDKQDEVVLQSGLDFGYFLSKGWFNDNHSKKTGDVLGWPEEVKRFAKGEKLPDGETAKSNLTWAEGYLLDTPQALKVWEVAKSLQKSDGKRKLGFSLEGEVERRSGRDNKTIAKAVIRHVAITQAPVGEETRLEAVEKATQLVKALTMGNAPAGEALVTPATGEGAGAVLALESLDGFSHKLSVNRKKKKSDDDDEDDEEESIAGMSKSMAAKYVQSRLACSEAQAARVINAVIAKERNMARPAKPSVEALNAALDQLEKSSLGSPNRQKELLQKASSGSITNTEQLELAKSLQEGGSIAASIASDFSTDTIEKSIEASAYLSDHAKSTLKGFRTIAEALEKSEVQDEAFRMGVARVFKSQNELIKSLVEVVDNLAGSVEAMGGAPARPAKSVGVANQGGQGAKPLQKSFGDEAGNSTPGTQPLVKSQDGQEWPVMTMQQATRTMTAMLTKGGIDSILGTPITSLVTRAQGAKEIHPAVLGEVCKWAATQKAAA